MSHEPTKVVLFCWTYVRLKACKSLVLYMTAQETHMTTKETYMTTKETYMTTKETYLTANETYTQKRRT